MYWSKSRDINIYKQFFGYQKNHDKDYRRSNRDIDEEEIQINFSNNIDELVYALSNTEKEAYSSTSTTSSSRKLLADLGWMIFFIRLKTYEIIFRFTDRHIFPSKEEVSIALEKGKLKKDTPSIVEADIPLLIGKPGMEEVGFDIDIGNKTLTVKKT